MRTGHHKLSAAKVAKCRTPGYLLDGGGLYLQITQRGPGKGSDRARTPSDEVTKSWTFRYRDRATGKLRELGLGSYADVTLEMARVKAAELRALLREHKDPFQERLARKAEVKAEKARYTTFDQAAAQCIADRSPGWKNQKHAAQWTSTLATYASPVIGSLPVSAIDLPLVRQVLDPIWTSKNETASRVRQRIEAVLAWATVSGLRSGENPARWKGHLDQLLPKPSQVQKTEHFPALAHTEMAAFMRLLGTHHGAAALALEFTILTACRTGEAIGVTWAEIDPEKGIWTIPAARMKARKEHTVPLSSRALAIVRELKAVAKSAYVFPGGKEGEPLSDAAMSALLRRMERTDISVHGFRSTFRDWAGEVTHFPREVIEHALAHQLKDKAEAAYARSTLLGKRRKLMEAWAEFCAGSEPDPAP